MLKLLLVDDEFFVREALKMIFEEIENVLVVGEAAFGDRALELFVSEDPDIIFLDSSIPGIEVEDLIRRIKGTNRQHQVIMLIDFASLNRVDDLVKIGVDDYIVKPISKEGLVHLIHKYLTLPRMETENSISQAKHKNNYPTNHSVKEIQAALEYIEENFQKGVTLEEVAEYVHLSPFYLSKLFKKEVNVNFVSYVMERKIEKAKDLLKETNMPVLNIALELNYQESNYFSKVFKKLTGITPSDYRKKYRKEKIQYTLLQKHHSIQNGNWHV